MNSGFKLLHIPTFPDLKRKQLIIKDKDVAFTQGARFIE